MTKRKYQTIQVNGRTMTFNFSMFQEMFLYMAEKEGKKIQEYERNLADLVFVDRSTVHNWRQSRNCPGSIEIIQAIASYWRIPVERLLEEAEPAAEEEPPALTPVESLKNPVNTIEEEVAHMNTMRKFTDREKDAVLRIYDHFLNYMEAFKKTQGFQASMDLPEDEFGPTDDAYTDMKEELMANLKHAVYREYIDLRDTVYEDLKYMVDNGVDSLICEELEAEGEFDEYIDSVCFDEETSEEEKEEILAKMEEDEESVFLAIYIGTMNYFQNIIDPYL